jgi:DNA-directed RNA polymerase II subunit RPB2
MDDKRFDILSKLLRGTEDLVIHHMDGYERLLKVEIPRIIREINPIKIPLVQKTKAKILETGQTQTDTDKPPLSSTISAAAGAAADAEKTDKDKDKDIEIDLKTYAEYDAVVSVYIGGLKGDAIQIYKPVRVSKNEFGEQINTPLLPNEARLRGLSYNSPISVDVVVRILNINTGEVREEEYKSIPIIQLPILVGSSACWLYKMTREAKIQAGEDADDPGGHFIINGAEKVLVTQERVIPNMAYVSSIPEVMMACAKPNTTQVKLLRLSFASGTQGQGILASIPGVKGLVPVAVLFRALGVISDKEIVKCIFNTDKPDPQETEIIRHTLASGHGVYDQHSAMRFLSHLSRGISIVSAKGIIHRQLFSQQTGGLPEKAALLGYMVRLLIHRKLERIQDTDRDSTKNKSVAVTGTLLGELISGIFEIREEEIRKIISSEYNYNYQQYKDEQVFQLFSIIRARSDDIFNEVANTILIMRSMKGQWGADPERGISSKIEGVSQALDRLTYLSTLSHLRRLVLERVPEGKALLARRVHMSTFGYVCPCETPAGGPKIGVVKNIAVLASVSAGVSPKQIQDELFKYGVRQPHDISYTERKGLYQVMINGILQGYIDDAIGLRDYFLKMRRRGVLHPSVSISVHIKDKLVWFGCGPGRLLRPLIRIKDGRPMIEEALSQLRNVISMGGKPRDVFSLTPFYEAKPDIDPDRAIRPSSDAGEIEAAMELIDPWEMETLFVSLNPEEITPDHTHMEIHPSTMFGIMGALIPFSPHNAGPRNLYSCSQSKQGTSVYTKSFMSRYDHSALVMTTTQKPMVSTWYGRQISPEGLTYGANLIVAISCFTGYNQEDGVLVNKTSVQRGLFRTLKFTEEVAEEEDNQKTKTKILFKDPRSYAGIRLKEDADYGYLDEDGLLQDGTIIKPGVVLFGIVAEQDGETPRDISIVAGRFDYGMIDSRVIIRLPGGLRRVRYRVSKFRMVEFGDKFSSRAGQKGTCGMLVDSVDMPRTVDGIIPDLIVNPHAIPSRMTIAQLQESVMCKLGSLLGMEIDSTAFTHNGAFSQNVGRLLKENGYDPAGDEMLYSGITGEMLPTKIFIGPTYYMRLKHMVADKINYRSGGLIERGPVDARTRQPIGGRAREGGLRIGEMERDAIISYGASRFLQESQTIRADGETAIICGESGKRGFYGDGKTLSTGYRSVERDGPMEFQGTTSKTLSNTRSYTDSKSFSSLTFPRSVSLLLNEMESMGIDTRIVSDTAMGDLVRPKMKVKLPDSIIDKMEGEAEEIASSSKITELERGVTPIELPAPRMESRRRTMRRSRVAFAPPERTPGVYLGATPTPIAAPGAAAKDSGAITTIGGGEGEYKPGYSPENNQVGLGRDGLDSADYAVKQLEDILEQRQENVSRARNVIRNQMGRGLFGPNIANMELEGRGRRAQESLISNLRQDLPNEDIPTLSSNLGEQQGGGLLSSLKKDDNNGGSSKRGNKGGNKGEVTAETIEIVKVEKVG